jgi:hypothetical protein
MMPRLSDRPYGRSSVSELEAIFRKGRADAEILRKLDHELGYRGTRRASKLRSIVIEARAARTTTGMVASPITVSERQTTGSPGMTTSPSATKLSASPPVLNPAPTPETLSDSTAVRGGQHVGALPSSPDPRERNEPTAILAAWTALEALSPQTYRRPEDLTSGDRRCVVRLSAVRVPWEIRETSRPNYQL